MKMLIQRNRRGWNMTWMGCGEQIGEIKMNGHIDTRKRPADLLLDLMFRELSPALP